MKKILLTLAISAIATTGLMAQANTQNITVGATLYQPIEIELVDNTNINFGTIGASSLTNLSFITLNPNDESVVGTTGTFFYQGTPTIAELSITGAGDADITVQIADADNGFTLTNGQDDILFKPSAYDGTSSFDAEELKNGEEFVLTGGSLTLFFGGVISDLVTNTATMPNPNPNWEDDNESEFVTDNDNPVWELKSGTFTGTITVSVSYN